jgi:catechol 2,3-dioxygenase-like lactoylglutathione lyase family enzyme
MKQSPQVPVEYVPQSSLIGHQQQPSARSCSHFLGADPLQPENSEQILLHYNEFKEDPIMPTAPSRLVGKPPAIETVVETAIYAGDLKATEAFYHNVLGLAVIARDADRHVFFRVGSGSVLLVFNPDTTLRGEVLPAHGARGPGHFALGIKAELLDVWRRHLNANDVAIEKEVTWPPGGKSLYFRDPAGTWWNS